MDNSTRSVPTHGRILRPALVQGIRPPVLGGWESMTESKCKELASKTRMLAMGGDVDSGLRSAVEDDV